MGGAGSGGFEGEGDRCRWADGHRGGNFGSLCLIANLDDQQRDAFTRAVSGCVLARGNEWCPGGSLTPTTEHSCGRRHGRCRDQWVTLIVSQRQAHHKEHHEKCCHEEHDKPKEKKEEKKVILLLSAHTFISVGFNNGSVVKPSKKFFLNFFY